MDEQAGAGLALLAEQGNRFSGLSSAGLAAAIGIAIAQQDRVVDTRRLAQVLLELDSGTAAEAIRAARQRPSLQGPAEGQRTRISSGRTTNRVWNVIDPPPPFAMELTEALLIAIAYADARGEALVRTGDLMLGVLDQKTSNGARVFANAGFSRRRLRIAAWPPLLAARDRDAREDVPSRPYAVEASAVLEASPDRVWHAVTSPELFAARMEDVEVITVSSTAGPDGRVQEIQFDAHQAGVDRSFRFAVLDHVMPYRWSVRQISDAGGRDEGFQVTWELQYTEAGTLVTVKQTGESGSPSPAFHDALSQRLQAGLIADLAAIERSAHEQTSPSG